MKPARTPDAGVTLIEMMIALALFALIGTAGLAMLDQVLRSQRSTEGRLERLSGQDRALHLILIDFSMAEPRSVTVADDAVTLIRSSGDGPLQLRYRLTDGTLHRILGQRGADQAILADIAAIRWRFLAPEGTWSDIWPADGVQTLTTPLNPRAVELLIALRDNFGQLRLVAPLPADLE